MSLADTQRSARRATWSLVALIAITLLRCAMVWPQLPPVVASHFDARGVPNGFQSRAAFMTIIVGMQVLMGLVFGVLPRFMRHIPPRMINLPHREYWLVPERIDQALTRYTTWSLWFGVATCALLLGILELALHANLTRTPMSPTLTWLLIGGYLLGTLVAIARLYVVFTPPKA